jgi:hypothetical protein
MEVSGQLYAPPLYLRERAPGTLWIRDWVGPRAVLDAVVKRKIPSSRRESNPRTPIFQPVTQRYTDSDSAQISMTLKFFYSSQSLQANTEVVIKIHQYHFLLNPHLFANHLFISVDAIWPLQLNNNR